MGNPQNHIPVKLIIGLIASDPLSFVTAKRALEKKFGKVDKESPILDFSCTHYYEREFGERLKRKFLSFKKLTALSKNYRIKLYTNSLEKKFSRNKRRTVNIDPGYVSLSKLVLFTTKNRSHRIYIDSGIFGDLELRFVKGSFCALEWTYPDYRTAGYIDFFNSVRALYVPQVKKYTSKG